VSSHNKLSHFSRSYLAAGRVKVAFMPAATRHHCIFCRSRFENADICFGPVPFLLFFGRLLVVYFRIAQIPRLNLACNPLGTTSGPMNRWSLLLCDTRQSLGVATIARLRACAHGCVTGGGRTYGGHLYNRNGTETAL
jgi:hypothetical protein